jgi:DNA-binding response OmpR family regulator
LVDDSRTVQDVVTTALAGQGHRVIAAGDLRHGARKLRTGAYDLILMDLNMPGVRGETGVRLVRQRLELSTPIIILSGEITARTIMELKPLGISGFVAKGDDFVPKLIEEVGRALAGGAR